MPKKSFMDKYKTYDTSEGYGSPSEWRFAFEERMNFGTVHEDDKKKHGGIAGPLHDAKNADELKKAYRTLMMQYHPDRNGDTQYNKTISQLLNDVYFEIKLKRRWK